MLQSLSSKSIVKRLEVKDPHMKLTPIMKLIGKLTVSAINKLTLFLLELFCIPIINNKKKQEFTITVKINFLNGNNIHLYFYVI